MSQLRVRVTPGRTTAESLLVYVDGDTSFDGNGLYILLDAEDGAGREAARSLYRLALELFHQFRGLISGENWISLLAERAEMLPKSSKQSTVSGHLALRQGLRFFVLTTEPQHLGFLQRSPHPRWSKPELMPLGPIPGDSMKPFRAGRFDVPPQPSVSWELFFGTTQTDGMGEGGGGRNSDPPSIVISSPGTRMAAEPVPVEIGRSGRWRAAAGNFAVSLFVGAVLVGSGALLVSKLFRPVLESPGTTLLAGVEDRGTDDAGVAGDTIRAGAMEIEPGLSDGSGGDPSRALESAAFGPVEIDVAWSREYGQPVTTSPRVSDRGVLFGCRDGGVYLLEAPTGDPIWNYESGAGVGASPIFFQDRVFGADYDGKVFALDAVSGSEVWTSRCPEKVVSTPWTNGKIVVVGCLNRSVYAFSAADGSPLWSYRTGGKVWGGIAGKSERVFASSLDGNLYALEAGSGKLLWKHATLGPIQSTPLLFHNICVVGSSDGKVHAVDQATGVEVWSTSLGGKIDSSPAFDGNRVYAGNSEGKFCALDPTSGRLIWSFRAEGKIFSRASVTAEGVFFTCYDGNFYALSTSTGDLLDRFEADGPIYSSPAVSDAMAYFGTNKGSLFALRLSGQDHARAVPADESSSSRP